MGLVPTLAIVILAYSITVATPLLVSVSSSSARSMEWLDHRRRAPTFQVPKQQNLHDHLRLEDVASEVELMRGG